MDARAHAIRESNMRWGYRFFLTFLLFIMAGSAFQKLAPEKPKVKTVTNTVTKTKAVPGRTVYLPSKTIYKTQLIPLAHKNDPAVGTMTANEFRSIRIGQSADSLDALFGNPKENSANDQKTFFPAAEGGTYWVYFSEGGSVTLDEIDQCYKDAVDLADEDKCVEMEDEGTGEQKVIRKEYKRE